MKPHLTLTLIAVARRHWRRTRDIWLLREMEDKRTTQRAVSNRLQELRAMGCVECRRVGKEKHWRRVNGGAGRKARGAG